MATRPLGEPAPLQTEFASALRSQTIHLFKHSTD